MITVFSIPRSGSTLIWNITKELVGPNVQKIHHCAGHDGRKTIIPYRHPYDSVVSHYNCHDGETIQDFNKDIDMLIPTFEDFLKYDPDADDVLFLKYEEFYTNPTRAIKSIALFLGVDVTDDRVQEIREKFCIANVRKIVERYDNFNQYDPKTHIHGNHIGNVKPNQWEYLSSVYKEVLYDRVGKYLDKMGY